MPAAPPVRTAQHCNARCYCSQSEAPLPAFLPSFSLAVRAQSLGPGTGPCTHCCRVSRRGSHSRRAGGRAGAPTAAAHRVERRGGDRHNQHLDYYLRRAQLDDWRERGGAVDEWRARGKLGGEKIGARVCCPVRALSLSLSLSLPSLSTPPSLASHHSVFPRCRCKRRGFISCQGAGRRRDGPLLCSLLLTGKLASPSALIIACIQRSLRAGEGRLSRDVPSARHGQLAMRSSSSSTTSSLARVVFARLRY